MCVLGHSLVKPIYVDFIPAYLDFVSTTMICTETIVKIHHHTAKPDSSIAPMKGLKVCIPAGSNHNYLEQLKLLIIAERKRLWHMDCLILRLTSARRGQGSTGSSLVLVSLAFGGSGRSLISPLKLMRMFKRWKCGK